MPKTKKRIDPDQELPEGRVTVVQVASYLGLSYQTARNQMLQGRFGPSEYDAKKRRLYVNSSGVRRKKKRVKSSMKIVPKSDEKPAEKSA